MAVAMEKGGDNATTIRIYIGGLAESVTAEDLKKTFSTPQLGRVESMDIIRTKGRSFAYLDLLPSSDKSLAKLFSTYNGCMWKGGRLRIEQAKEHFFLRMKREWEEDAAALATTSSHLPVTGAEMTNSLKNQKKRSKLDDTWLRIYFPKLGKIKPVPFRGSGKHKYSFQRVEVPSLPIHFCDCEEHSSHPDTTKQNSLCDGGMDEKELNIMNSVLNKIIEGENYPGQAPRNFKLAKEVRSSNSTADHLQNDKNLVNQEIEDDDNLILNVVGGANERTTMLKDPAHQAMIATQVNENFVDQEMDDDDDNLIINVVANDKTTLFEDPSQEAIAAIKKSLSKESHLAEDKQGQGRKLSSNKKRKAPSENEHGEANALPSKPKSKRSLNAPICDRTEVCPTEVKSGRQPSNRSAKLPKKPPWKDLVSASSDATFSVSDTSPSAIHGSEMLPGCDGVTVSNSPDKKDEKVSDQHKELDKVAKDSTGDLNGPVDIYARGAAWRQKSSWTQLIRDTTSSSFSISQILPCSSLRKHELPTMGVTEKVQKSSRTDISDSQDISTSQGGTKADALSAPGTSSGGAIVKEQKNVHFGKELPQLDNHQQKGKLKNEHPSALEQALLGDTYFSETCSFMRSAASMKEWMKTKAALSGSRKSKTNEKK